MTSGFPIVPATGRADGMSLQIVVVDDQPLFVSAFAALVETSPEMTIVGTALDGRRAVELCESKHVDVVLMDIEMPRMGGIEAARRIRRLPSAPAVLMLSTFARSDYVVDALRVGASGYLLKDSDADEFLGAIREVAKGRTIFDAEVASHVVAALRLDDHEEPADQVPVVMLPTKLTAREREVLEMVAAGLTNSEIADQLVVARTTVKSHVSALLTKLDCRDRVALAVLAHRTVPIGRSAPADFVP